MSAPFGDLEPAPRATAADAPFGDLDPIAEQGAALAGSALAAQKIPAAAARGALDAARRAGVPADVALRRSEEVGADLRRRGMPLDEIAQSPALAAFFSDPVRAAAAQERAAELVALRRALGNAQRPLGEILEGRVERGRGNVRLGDLVLGRMRGTLTAEEDAEWGQLVQGGRIAEDRMPLEAAAALAARGNREAQALLTHGAPSFLTPEQDQARAALADTIGRSQPGNLQREALGAAAEQLPMLARGGAGGVVGAAIPALVAVGGVALGQPEVAGPAAALIPVGARVGAGAAFFPINLGESYANLEGLTFQDASGKPAPVPRAAVNGAAVLAASVKTGLDLVGLEALVGMLPGGGAFLRGPVEGLRARVEQALASRPELVQALAKFGASYVAAIGAESSTEAVQTAVDIAARAALPELAQGRPLVPPMAPGGVPVPGPDGKAQPSVAGAVGEAIASPSGRAEIAASAREAALATATFGAGAAALTGVVGAARRARQDTERRKAYAEVAAAAGKLEDLRGTMPGDLAELVQKLADEQGVPVTYAEPQDLAELFQADPDRWRVLSPETQAEIAEAAETGRVAAIPTGEYLTHLEGAKPAAAGPVGKAEAPAKPPPEVRLDPGQLSEEELASLLETASAEVAAAPRVGATAQPEVSPAAQSYFERMRDALAEAASTPYDRRQAAVVATLVREAVTTRAARLGIPVEEAIAQEQGLRFLTRPVPAPARARPDLLGAPVQDVTAARRLGELQRAIADLRESKTPEPKQKQPVLSLLRALGRVQTGTALASELAAMDVTPKRFPGLFSKRGKVAEVDTLIGSEHPILATLPRQEGTDYIDREAVLEAIRSELRGNPLLPEDEAARFAELEAARGELQVALGEAGVDIQAMADEDAARALLAYEGQRMDEELFQTAWQGSPTKRLEGGKFSTEFIGSGENTLGQGWGLYFSSKRAVGEWYRQELAEGGRVAVVTFHGNDFAVDGTIGTLADFQGAAEDAEIREEALTDTDRARLAEEAAVHLLAGAQTDDVGTMLPPLSAQTFERRKLAALDFLRREVARIEGVVAAQREKRDRFRLLAQDDDLYIAEEQTADVHLQAFTAKRDATREVRDLLVRTQPSDVRATSGGQPHRVELPEDEHLLDWTLALHEHPEPVRSRLARLAEFLYGEGYSRGWETKGSPLGRRFYLDLAKTFSHEGARAIDRLEAALGPEAAAPVVRAWKERRAFGPELASRALAAAGVPGHSYVSNSGNRNFVIYDDAAIEPLETYYQRRLPPDERDVLERLRPAVRDPATGTVYDGSSHRAAIDKASRDGETWARLFFEWDRSTENAGFLDPQTARFISREEAERRWQVLTEEDRRDALLGSRERRRQEGPAGEVKGSISLSPDMRDALIRFTEAADLTTGLHELMHYYTLRLEREAQDPDAPEWMQRDAETLVRFARRQPEGPLEGPLDTAAKERLADAGLAYLRDGRAPSPELRSAFARFREWLSAFIRSLRELLGDDVLPDDVRAVFDRMFATDEAIARAREEDVIGSIFAAEQLTDEEKARLSRSVAAFDGEVRNAVDREQFRAEAKRRDLFSKIQREREEGRRAELERILVTVNAELDRDPVWQADAYLREIPGEQKLSRGVLLEMFGADTDAGRAVREVPTGARSWLSATDGVHPDEYAEQFGFDVGADLVRGLLAAGSKEAGSRARVAEAIARERLRSQGALSPGEIEEVALRALAGEKRIDFLLEEERILAARAGSAPTPRAVAEEQVRRILAEKQIRDLRPDVHRATARRARREALIAARADDFTAAAAHLRRELLHTMLEQETRRAREESAKILGNLRRADRDGKLRKRIGKAMGGYLEALDGILEQVELRIVPLRETARRAQVFATWVAEHRKQGDDLVVPEWLLEYRRRNWRTLTMNELRGLAAAVETIIHNATEATEIRIEGELREREAVVDELVAGLGVLAGSVTRSDRLVPPKVGELREVTGRLDRFFAGARAGDAMLTSKEHLVDVLARGDTRGIWHQAVVKPLLDADDAYRTSRDDYRDKLRAVLERFGDASGLSAEIDEKRLRDPRTGRPFILTRWDLLSIALNTGNAGNFEKLVGGYEWNPDNVRQVLDDHLTEREWALVQDLFDLVETLWPAIVAQQRAVTGIVPEKVEATPIQTKFGQELRGGYWPVVYDPARSVKASVYAEAEVFEKRANGSAYVETDHGFTERRTAVADRAVQLDGRLVLERHLDEVLLDLAFRPALLRTSKLLRDERLNRSIREKLGPEFDYARFWKPWLQWIAGDTADVGAIGILERTARVMRLHATSFKLGLRLSTLLVQPSGLALSVGVLAGLSHGGQKVGAKAAAQHLIRGLWTALGGLDPARAAAVQRDVAAASPFMRDRPSTLDQDLRDLIREAGEKHRLDLRAQAFAAHLISSVQYFAADVPTWLAARAIARERMGMTEAEAVAFADSRVRLAQGGGSRIATSNVVNGSEFWKSLNLFYSFRNVVYNLLRANLRARRNFPAFLAAHTFYLSSGAVASVGIGLLVAAAEGREPPDDWEEDAAGRLVVGEAVGLLPFGADAYQALRDGAARAPGALGLYLNSLADLGSSKGLEESLFDTVRWFGLVLGAPVDWPATALERRLDEEPSRGRRGRGNRAQRERGE